MWELDCEEGWAPKYWCFWAVVLEKTLESPLDCKEIQPVHLKEVSPRCSLEGLMLNLKLQYFGHLMRRVDSLEKTLMLEGLGAGEGDNRGWDGWMASPTWWTWVWVNSGSWWWTGRPGTLRFMGSQRVGHDWATELNWGLQFGHRLMISICICPGIVNGRPKLQSLKSHPWSGHAAWDPFPIGTPDVLWHETSQHWFSLDIGQNPI